LKAVDALLHDLARPQLAARAIAGVDSLERFSELFPVQGWRPVDADLQVSDVPGLVSLLGGAQLYGREPEVGVRELLQNAQDAVVARRVIDPGFSEGAVVVTLTEQAGEWTLEVRDNGVGMDEEVLVHGLLDFGRTGWRSSTVRAKFRGLASGGFQPRGRFGIGFFSIFMLGDDVEIITRRFDAGRTDARRLEFRGVAGRPLLTQVPVSERVPPGTTVRVRLKANPYEYGDGIFHRTPDENLWDLVQRLLPDSAVPVRTDEPGARPPITVVPFSTSSASAEEIFDRLYPPWQVSYVSPEQRSNLRSEFARLATEVLDSEGRRVGLAVLGHDLYFLSHYEYFGVVMVNGLHSDDHVFFAGYLDGKPSRASRDKVEFVAHVDGLREWLRSQVRVLRGEGLFTTARQIEFAHHFYRAFGELSDDHIIGMTSNGLVRVGDIESWAAGRDEVFLGLGPPLMWTARPPAVRDSVSGVEVALPDSCITMCNILLDPVLQDVFPSVRDKRYESARQDRSRTWQKRWWRLSGNLEGQFLKKLCHAWDCDIGDLLRPAEHRDWSDSASLGMPGLPPLRGIRLDRP
jgi:Histidine kinase-, DNA gyrase B-, and HSP90-like ATPase